VADGFRRPQAQNDASGRDITMGLFDFLNPKKKIEKLLQDKVGAEVVAKAIQLIKEKGEEAAKDQVKTFAADKMKEQASAVIPAPLQSKAGEIIDSAAEKMADKALVEAKKAVGL
jgi:hypothetical protein